MQRTLEIFVALAPLALVSAMIYFLLHWRPRHKGLANLSRIENSFWVTVLLVSLLLLGFAALNRR